MDTQSIISRYELINTSPSRILPAVGTKKIPLKKANGSFIQNNGKVDFNQLKYDMKDFFNDKCDQTKMNCSLANEYSPFNSGTRRWESVTKLIMTNLNYSASILNKRKDTNFDQIKNYPFIYRGKKADLQKNIRKLVEKKQQETMEIEADQHKKLML